MILLHLKHFNVLKDVMDLTVFVDLMDLIDLEDVMVLSSLPIKCKPTIKYPL